MASQPTRISPDVWNKAVAIAKQMGLPSGRVVIEGVFRVYSDSYAAGSRPSMDGLAPVSSQPEPISVEQDAPDATSALDNF